MKRDEYNYYKRQAHFVARQVAFHYPVDDMVAEGMASLVTSLRSYNPASRMSLGSYILQHMRWAMLDAARVWRKGSRLDSSQGLFYCEVPLDQDTLPEVPPTVDTDKVDLARAVSKLPPKRRKFMEAYLKCDDIDLAAKAVGISRECGWQHHFKAVRTLRKILG